MFYETQSRTVIKTILWRIVVTLITWSTIYYYTGQLKESVKITIVAAIIGMTAYYIYERVWNKIQWGKKEEI
jgi:uncharacterized membrane protein